MHQEKEALVAGAPSTSTAHQPSSVEVTEVPTERSALVVKKVAEHFPGLNGARILAAIHIILAHASNADKLGAPLKSPVWSWGGTWVPWFFMLSGFVLSHGRLQSLAPDRSEPVLNFLRKRTAGLYPLYASVLLLSMLIGLANGTLAYAQPVWWIQMSQAVLVQAWTPWTLNTWVMFHCWFLSALVPFWALFDTAFRHMILRLRGIAPALATLALFAALPWVYYTVTLLVGQPMWYQGGPSAGLVYPLFVMLLKYNPLFYVHIFLFGMVLARTRQLVAGALLHASTSAEERPPRVAQLLACVFRVGTSLGYSMLFAAFFSLNGSGSTKEMAFRLYRSTEAMAGDSGESWGLPGLGMAARLGLLMVPQGLIIAGLAPLDRALPTGFACFDRLIDPLEWLLGYSPMVWGSVSYAQYLLQFVAFQLYPGQIATWVELVAFLVSVSACAYVAAITVVAPAARWWLKRRPAELVATFALVALAAALLAAMGQGILTFPTGTAPDAANSTR